MRVKLRQPDCRESTNKYVRLWGPDLDRHLTNGCLDRQESASPNGIPIVSAVFCTVHLLTNTDTQTTLRATYVAIAVPHLCSARDAT